MPTSGAREPSARRTSSSQRPDHVLGQPDAHRANGGGAAADAGFGASPLPDFEGLPEQQRLAVIMHKYQQMEYRQIADVLKLSESATKSLLFRAYETLREQLKEFV